MAPEGSKPLHMSLHQRVTGEVVECIANVAAPHLLDSPEQIARIVEHDSWVAAFVDQFRQQVGKTPIAVGEWLCVVVVTLVGVIEHVLKMGDQAVVRPRRHRWLVHVKSTGKSGTQLFKIDRAVGPHVTRGQHHSGDVRFSSADRGTACHCTPLVMTSRHAVFGAACLPNDHARCADRQCQPTVQPQQGPDPADASSG